MPRSPRTPRSASTLLSAILAVGAAVFGAVVAGLVLAGALPSAAGAPALLGALTLGLGSGALALVRRPARPRRGAAATPAPADRLEVVGLGDGQAAVVIEESPGARQLPRATGAEPGEAAAAAAAIWDAVGAAARAADAEPDRTGARATRADAARSAWTRRLLFRPRQGTPRGHRRPDPRE
ncbi:hypothetical protein FJ250_13855 [bacterium]|nr:hypothetical protein [bacterium]